MNKQNGAISGALVAVLSVFGIIAAIVGFVVILYFSASNYGVKAEAELEAVWVNNQNILGQYTLKVQEIAQVPEMYKNDLKEVMQAELSARYGKEGSQALTALCTVRSNKLLKPAGMSFKMRKLV